MNNSKRPILYSFRRCPYAIRARSALQIASIEVEHREVDLKNKPASLLNISPKGTVPVLELGSGKIIEESLDIMNWALTQADPDHWLVTSSPSQQAQCDFLLERNDSTFKHWLDRYKYAVGYPERKQTDYRQEAEAILFDLEKRLEQSAFLLGENYSLADAAIMPFVRQFAFVDYSWFEHSDYPKLRRWLETQLQSGHFARVMQKHPLFQS